MWEHKKTKLNNTNYLLGTYITQWFVKRKSYGIFR